MRAWPALLLLSACDKSDPTGLEPTTTGACDEVTWYADSDGDGHGVATSSTVACANAALDGYVTGTYDDCNDGNPQVHPGLSEVCDGIDQDCDGAIDEEATGTWPWHADVDGDGYGDPDVTRDSCEQPAGYVGDATDCDDLDPEIHPSATETCNDADDDCDGTVDDPDTVVYVTWYPDADLDGYGDGTSGVDLCGSPGADLLADGSDCDDADPSVHPGAEEVCNDVDDDCDGTIDDPDALAYAPWYLDADGDTWGDPTTAVDACRPVDGRIAAGSDCDDTDPAVFPGAPEACNGVDDDCDGTLDDAELFSDWYPDGDSDGWGAGSPVSSCAPISGRVDVGGDCADGDPDVHPEAAELCNGQDDDCDGIIDNPEDIYHDWYVDSDGDGYGDDDTAISSCTEVPDRVLEGGDCAVLDPTVHPGADDSSDCNGIDDDCNGVIDDGSSPWYLDADGDGYGDAAVAVDACGPPPGYVDNGEDCDDTDATVVACGGDVSLTGRCGGLSYNETIFAPSDPEIHVLGVYEPDRASIDVGVDRPGEEVVLVVSSYEPVAWTINVMPGTTLTEVVLNGYNTHTYVVPAGVTVTRRDGIGRYWEACGYELPSSPHSGCETEDLITAVETYFGRPITSFAGCYDGVSFEVGTSP